MSHELKQYMKETLQRGSRREEIIQTLSESGWSLAVIEKTLEQFAGVDAHGTPIPAPRMQAHHIARDWCLYLLMFATLSMSACALGGLLFTLIEYAVEDASVQSGHVISAIHWNMAQLLVSFPAYSGLAWMIHRRVTQHPEKRESLIRKLMIYLIVAVTSLVALGDWIAVLNRLLEGELTLRFMAKALVVFVIAGIIFMYYLSEMRRDDALVKQ